MTNAARRDIEVLWKEHLELPFPSGLAGESINGVDVVSLDGDIAGCVEAYISMQRPNLFQVAILGMCYRDVSVALPHIAAPDRDYFRRLEKLSELVLKEVVGENLPDD